MSKIAIVTDSTSDLSAEVVERFGIRVLPLQVVYHDREYADRIEIQPEEVYAGFDQEIPKTSMPSVGDTRQLFLDLEREGYTHVICMHISSGLSGTYEMVKMVGEQTKDLKIEVIDSKALSLGLGWLVHEAAKLVEAGLTFEDVVSKLYTVRDRIKVFFVVKTLEFLKKGGRIGLVEATLGEMFDVKPIISINPDGKYYSYCKVRGRKKSIEKITDIIHDLIGGKRVNLAVMHGDALEEAQQLLDRLLKLPDVKPDEVVFGQIGPVMVVHTGPGLLGIALQLI